MSDNIRVKPSTETGLSVPVATDVIDGIHYPVYKMTVSIDGAMREKYRMYEDNLLATIIAVVEVINDQV
jgi:hypothetical protein|tara:strand:+ start:358 stop:564 length:207 start_codon:yes stop_codon:yes gene_type:complete